MKKVFNIIFILVFLIIISSFSVSAKEKTIVYFYEPSCGNCIKTTPLIDKLRDEGINVIKYDVTENENLNLFYGYCATYFIEDNEATWPIVFSGDKYYIDDDILNSLDDIKENANNDLKEVNENLVVKKNLEGFIGFSVVLFAGLLDGFNPCAMAMLLLFISLLGFSSNKKALIGISFTYIFALFITYFALGTFLFKFLHLLDISYIVKFVNWFIIILCLFLFIFNIYDYIVSKNEKYGKIKLQLPKSIQKFNKKIIKFFTDKVNNNSKFIYVLTFLLGVIITFTEFMCTGQIYLPIIVSLVQFSDSLNITAILYLLVYNLAFVLPLILIAVIAIKSNSIISTSDIIRKNLHLIKLLNSILFLAIAVYYIFFTVL